MDVKNNKWFHCLSTAKRMEQSMLEKGRNVGGDLWKKEFADCADDTFSEG